MKAHLKDQTVCKVTNLQIYIGFFHESNKFSGDNLETCHFSAIQLMVLNDS